MPKTRSVEECTQEFLLEKTAGETRRAYLRSLKDFLAYAKVQTPEDLAQVDRATVVRFRNRLREGKGCSPAYVNRTLAAVSGFFKWLQVEEVIRYNPCDLVRRYKVSAESRTEGLSEEEVQAMIDVTKDGTLRGLRDRAILVTLYYEGLRRGSLARLDMRDLRGHRQMLVLRQTKTSGLSIFYSWVDSAHPLAGAIERKTPADWGTIFVALPLPRIDVRSHFVERGDPSIQALASQDAKFVLSDVEPTAMLGGVVDFQTLRQ